MSRQIMRAMIRTMPRASILDGVLRNISLTISGQVGQQNKATGQLFHSGHRVHVLKDLKRVVVGAGASFGGRPRLRISSEQMDTRT